MCTCCPKKTKIVVVFNPEKTKVMFGDKFCFLFLKTCFWEYKEKKISCILEIKNMFG